MFAFYWLFSYTNCPIQHSFMAIHTYMYWSNLIFNLKRTIIFKCFIQNNNTELSSKVATENVELVRPDSVWLQVKTSHWEISIQVNVDRTDGDISESAKLKMTESVCNGALSQCQNTHTHFCCLVTLWVISQLAVLWLRDIFFFFFIKLLKLITTTRMQKHYQLFHRTTLLTEPLRYTRVDFTTGSLLMVLRHVKSFRTYHAIMQTHYTFHSLSLIIQNQQVTLYFKVFLLQVTCTYYYNNNELCKISCK